MGPRPYNHSLLNFFFALLFFLTISQAHESIPHAHVHRHGHHHGRYERRIDVLEPTDLASNEMLTNSSSLVRRNDGSCARDRPCGNKACCGPSGFCGYGMPRHCEMIKNRRADPATQVQNTVDQDVCPTATQEPNVANLHRLQVNSVHSTPGEYMPHTHTVYYCSDTSQL